MRKTILLLALLFGLAHAQVTISGPRSLEAAPGSSTTVEYVIHNQTEAPADVTLFVQDLVQLADGTTVHLDPGTTPNSLDHVLSLQTITAVVPAGQSVSVPATLDLPADPQPAYWGVIGAETPPPANEGGGVGFHVRYAMATKLDVQDLERHELLVHDLALQEDGSTLQLTVENAGTSYERAEVALEFHDASGPVATTTQPLTILPNTVLDLTIDPPSELEAGTYGVFTTVSYDEDQIVEHITSIQLED